MMTGPRSIGRIEVRGQLVADTPLRVGSTRSETDIDLTVLRDGLGRVLVPGDSLAGAMRAWASVAFPADDRAGESPVVEALFGPTPEAGKRKNGGLAAGLLTVSDAAFDAAVEARTGVGIDRATGAAAPEVFYSFEVVPRGTVVPLHLELELPVDETQRSEPRAVLRSLLAALSAGEIGIGGMRSRGLGEVHLDPATLSVREFLFTDATSTAQALSGGSPLQLDDLGVAPVALRRRLTATVEWAPDGAVLSKDTSEGLGVNTLPLMGSIGGGKVAAVLPGSSLKGVLRSHAEWFCRTLAPVDVQPATNGDEFLAQVAGIRPVDLLFGTVKRAQRGDEQGPESRRGALNIPDCYAEMALDQEVWRDVVDAIDDQAVAKLVDKNAKGLLDPAMHVAIDRFTGGAAESLLYSVLEVRAPWQPLRLILDLDQLSRQTNLAEQHAAIGLFYVLEKMLRHEMIRLGFGTMRGAGRMRVASVDIQQPHDEQGDGSAGLCDRATALKALGDFFAPKEAVR
jgi:CRISPR/Cas system CSM-associated protein Csm3 (group 7 of RAMP superfamily)